MAAQEGPGVAACPGCGGHLLGGELPNLRGRRADLRIGHTDANGHVIVYECPDPDCAHLWPRYTEGRHHDEARAMILWHTSRRNEAP